MEEISIMQIKCPNCGAECETEGELIVGQHFICPFCSEKFEYDGVGQGNNAEENCHREVTTKCPHCGTVYEVDESLEGNSCQCSVCNKDFVVNVVQFVEVSGEHSSALTADEKEESKAYVSDKLAEEMDKATKAGNMQDNEIETVESGKPFLFKMKTVLITTKKKIITWWENGEEGRHLFFSKVKVTAIRTKDGVVAWWNGGKDGRYTLFCKAKATAISAKDKTVLLWNCGAKGKIAIGVTAALVVCSVIILCMNGKKDGQIIYSDGMGMMASQNKVEDSPEVKAKPEVAVKPDERAETQSDMAKSRTTSCRRRSTEAESLLEQRNGTKESSSSENHDENVKFTGTYTWSYDLNYGDATIKGVSPKIGDIRIPSTVGEGNYPVTGIGHGAFWRYSGLTSVAIPNGVTYIGEGAFRECVNLKSVTIPDSVTDIETSAFKDCSGLKNLTIGKGVSKIGVSVFSGCSSLTSVTIPESVKYISFSAFENCKSLKNVKTMNPNTIIMNNAFAGCDALANGAGFSVVSGVLTCYSGKGGNVTIPTGVTSIGSYAFESSRKSLASVIIPSSVTSIGESAFSGCKNLSKVTIEKGVTSIGASAFSGCEGLTSVKIPNSVKSIEEGAFSSCESLTSVTIPDSVTSIGKTAFYKCKNLQSVTIPDFVTSIGEMAFYGCKSLNEITIPDSVKRIGNAAFGGCDRITKASIPETLEDFKNEIFDGCKALSFKRGLTVRQLAGSSGYEERVKTYRLEAARGNADAQYELGVCYMKGKGVGKDIAEAAKWWQKAANQGHVDAQFQLGCLYYQGEGVKGNLPEAVNLWRKAAAQGQADALCNLGAFYYDGFPAGNVPRDRIEGLRLLRMAVEKGNKNAKEILFRIKWDAGNRDF